jgi:hypothetical protein
LHRHRVGHAVLIAGLVAALAGCGGTTYRTGGGVDESAGEAQEAKQLQLEEMEAAATHYADDWAAYEAEQTYRAGDPRR